MRYSPARLVISTCSVALLGTVGVAQGQLPDSAANLLYKALEQRINYDGVGMCVALSGGGMRATAFHAGVLRTLDDLPKHLPGGRSLALDGIDVLAAVSGGSLTAALYTLTPRGSWDSSGVSQLRDFLRSNPIQQTMTDYVLGWAFTRNVKNRIRYFEDVVHRNLLRQATFGQLPKSPHLVIVTKNFRNGRDVRFTQLTMRDHPNFFLAKAVAASGAIPVIFNPMTIDKILVHSDIPDLDPQVRGELTPLFDGGVHDNLAVDPLLVLATDRPGRQRLCDIVFLSDATEIEFDKEIAQLDTEFSVVWRTLGLLMARIVSLQSVVIGGMGVLKDRAFVIKMPARFNQIAATRDLGADEITELIEAGQQSAVAVIGDGSSLTDQINLIRRSKRWRR